MTGERYTEYLRRVSMQMGREDTEAFLEWFGLRAAAGGHDPALWPR